MPSSLRRWTSGFRLQQFRLYHTSNFELRTSSLIILSAMLPAFFDSVLQLIVRTSTDLPPDVRAAMRMARDSEPAETRSGQALTIIAQNIDLAVESEGAICQDTGMPTFEVKTPVGANQIWMRQQIREAVAEATKRGKLRPNSVDSITGDELRQQSRPWHANHPLRTVGKGRDRGQAHPERRWLREHQRAVLVAVGVGASRPRRPDPRRGQEGDPARRVERAGEGMCAWRRRCLRRRRPHLRLHPRQGAVVSNARRCESGSEVGGARSVDHGVGEQPGDRRRWDSAATSR